MYMDFLDLSKVCPKNSYPLSKIDKLVDAATAHAIWVLWTPSWGYHQTPVHLENQQKTTFITAQGLCYHKFMPFGLKNTGETYQNLVNKLFEALIEWIWKCTWITWFSKAYRRMSTPPTCKGSFKSFSNTIWRLTLKNLSLGLSRGNSWGVWWVTRG